MKPFSSVTVVKHPLNVVWVTIRDRLPELVPYIDNIEGITQLKREELPDGNIRLDNLWQLDSNLSSIRAANLARDDLRWIDRAEWQLHSHVCHWQIEPHFMSGQMTCRGLTRYEPAIGGRGTRITFEGQLNIAVRNEIGASSFLDGTLLRGFESLASTLVPRNLRKLAEAVSSFLDNRPPS